MTSKKFIPQEYTSETLAERYEYYRDHCLKVIEGRGVHPDEVEDVYQDAWSKVLERIQNPIGLQHRYFSEIVLNTVRSQALLKLKIAKRKKGVERKTAANWHDELPEHLFDDYIHLGLLQEKIEQLSEDERYLVQKYYFEGHTFSDIAESLKVSSPTASNKIQALRMKLMRYIDRNYPR